MALRDIARKNRSVVVLVLMLVLSFLGMWSSGGTGLAAPKEVGMTLLALAQTGVSGVSSFVTGLVDSVKQLADLKNQYNALLAKVSAYELNQTDIESLKSENARLRQILGFSQELGYKNIPARVIGKDPGIYFSTFTINKGFNDGVRKGMPVVGIQDGKQGLIGKILIVGPLSAQVQALFDPGMHVSARLAQTRFDGLVDGSGSATDDLPMSFVSTSARSQVNVGDAVVSSGTNSLYPPDLLIGTVSSVESLPYELSLSLRVKPFIDFGRLENVFLLSSIEPKATP